MKTNSARLRHAALVVCACVIHMHTAAASDLTISGAPATGATVGLVYDFHPQATAVGSQPVHFEIANAPSWATFVPFDGELTGTPGATDSGIYPDITISLTDGTSQVSLPPFSIVVYMDGGTLTEQLTWLPPSYNSDGSALTDLAGYNIYEGPSADALAPIATADASASQYVLSGLPPGTHYFAITAVNVSSVESDLSPIVNDAPPPIG